MTDTQNTNSSLLDKSGKPLKIRLPLLTRWRRISSKVKTILISLTSAIALIAILISNIGTIKNFLGINKVIYEVPNITVKLSNSSKTDVVVARRGDFILWLPGLNGSHTMGKYEFLNVDGKSLLGSTITIYPNDTVTFQANIMNKYLYSKILVQADCDITLQVFRQGAGFIHTNEIPFEKDAIQKYYISADVGL